MEATGRPQSEAWACILDQEMVDRSALFNNLRVSQSSNYLRWEGPIHPRISIKSFLAYHWSWARNSSYAIRSSLQVEVSRKNLQGWSRLRSQDTDAAKLARVAQQGVRYEPSVKLQSGPFQASKPTVCTIGSLDRKLVDEEFLSLLGQRYISTEHGTRTKCRKRRVRSSTTFVGSTSILLKDITRARVTKFSMIMRPSLSYSLGGAHSLRRPVPVIVRI